MPPKKVGAQNGHHGGNKPYAKAIAIPAGQVLDDLSHQKWKVGKSIGSGGFGDIYLANDDITKPVSDKANYVVKIEPHSNGPLFVEIAFYIRTAKAQLIEEWKQLHRMDSLGMPHYVASGAHEYNHQKFRFLVLPRYGQDLYKIISQKPGKRFNHKTVFAIALQIMDIYQYIHSKEFVHADVKASNLALELNGNKKKQQVYLLDFGLALKFVDANGRHCVYGPDARKAHNGTLEYASRDAHIGAFGRRGDLEVLGYNMLEWLCGRLPWSRDAPPEVVHKQKEVFMSDINLKKIYPADIQGLDIVERFLKYVATLNFETEPDYARCREMLKKGLPTSPKGTLFLEENAIGSPTKKKTATKRRSVDVVDSISKKLCVPEEESPKRSTRTTKKVKDFNWARVLSTDPEKLVRAATLSQQANGHKDMVNGTKTPSPIIANPTPAMLQILSKKKENLRTPTPIKTKNGHTVSTTAEGTSHLTPAMKEILMRRRRLSTSLKKAKTKKSTVNIGASTVTASTRSRRNK